MSDIPLARDLTNNQVTTYRQINPSDNAVYEYVEHTGFNRGVVDFVIGRTDKTTYNKPAPMIMGVSYSKDGQFEEVFMQIPPATRDNPIQICSYRMPDWVLSSGGPDSLDMDVITKW